MGDPFTDARLARLEQQDNTNTTPLDALRLAERHLETVGSSGLLMVLIEREGGGVAIYSAGTTLAESVFLLESAKVILFEGESDDA